jgi:5-methylcytosine-specific restriction endonuclease McrA
MSSEKQRKYARDWNKRNPEKHLAGVKKFQANNPEKVRLWWAVWYKANRENSKLRLRLWRKKNKEKKRGYDRTRRAHRHGADGAHTSEQFKKLCEAFYNLCLCCLKKKTLTEDHVIPLVKGGTDFIDNIQPLCRSCNSKKNTKIMDYRTSFARRKKRAMEQNENVSAKPGRAGRAGKE